MTAKIDTGTTIATVFVELSPNFPFAVVSTSDSVVPPTFAGIVVPPTFAGIVVPPTFAGIVICVFKLVFVGGAVSRSFFYNFICSLPLIVNFTESKGGIEKWKMCQII